MSNDDDAFPLPVDFFQQLRVADFAPLYQFFFGNAEDADEFQHQIAQVAVEFPGNAFHFLWAFVWKGVAQVGKNDLAAVPQQVEQDDKGEVGKQIRYPQR